jgi:8-oxo-dGTP diphosphatase
MKLIFGTNNPAKIHQLTSALKNLDIAIQGLPADRLFPEIAESGTTALANARCKALTYARLIGHPVFSMDNALYFNNLPADQQPGLHVRRINNRADRPTDIEIINYYSQLIRGLGDRVDGYWEYGVCAATPVGETKEVTFRSLRIFVSQPSPKIIAGYPLESLQIDQLTGKYSSEMTPVEKENFYQARQTTGQRLRDFIINLPAYFFIDN